MPIKLSQLKQDFTEGLSQISRFWGFPKGMGAIFAVLYLSQNPLSLDEIVEATGLTKGAVSTEVRTLARMGLVHRSSKLADRKDYYMAEDDFYKSIRSILKERQNNEFDSAIRSVGDALSKLEAGDVTGDKSEVDFTYKRIQALQEFFNAIDSLTRAVVKLESLGFTNVKTILSVLK
ncbi:MAG TPA: MarR family transcriptional regulator [Anaerolineales bacterium]|nr:MarR family transcriptional regulator [Anaerolineales bacterium]HMX73030.1 MarR family transcriptional regulator [Anaerolineales bacterium]HNH77200.1 MarR family transcriptional regulator [Anaerolineales bacterium]